MGSEFCPAVISEKVEVINSRLLLFPDDLDAENGRTECSACEFKALTLLLTDIASGTLAGCSNFRPVVLCGQPL